MILQDGETIVAEIRKHWFVFVQRLYLPVFLAILPWIIIFGINRSPLTIPEMSEAFVWIAVFVYALWLMVLWTGVFLIWTDYYLDVWIVTPERIIDIEQRGLFSREISSIRFERVQDITTEVNGMVATMLEFGTLHVQSAGDSREIKLEGARRPSESKKILLQQLNQVMQYRGRGQVADSGDADRDSDASYRQDAV